ncbi:MAG: heavy metal translocating P-type ATPase [Candidatus Aenigmarchaeota archaeon]|nr:heavy metal translocating P-type ATPase [Candidatus Aenigmarchaeota archaeon]
MAKKKAKNAEKAVIKEDMIEIWGMHCKSCMDKIESEVGSMDGVDFIRANLIENKAMVRYDSSKIGLGKIYEKIRALGYKAGGDDAVVDGADKSKMTFTQGVAYALVPHIGCIAFIIGSVLGATLLMEFFKPLLMNRFFFHILVAISIGFATVSSAFYLRKNGLLSFAGAMRKWQYLSTMYGSTVGINLLLFLIIFPMLANLSSVSAAGAVVGADLSGGDSILRMAVDIPCPGHAPLISEELKAIDGVVGVKYSFPNIFDVAFDSLKTSKDAMLSLVVFGEYPATVLEESSEQGSIEQFSELPESEAASCCGSSTCGVSSGGSCGCGGYRG